MTNFYKEANNLIYKPKFDDFGCGHLRQLKKFISNIEKYIVHPQLEKRIKKAYLEKYNKIRNDIGLSNFNNN